MTCKERGRVAKLTCAMQYVNNPELSSPEETRCQFNGSKADIKLGIDVHQDFYVVVEQVGGSNPKPAQRFGKEAFLHWAAKLKSRRRRPARLRCGRRWYPDANAISHAKHRSRSHNAVIRVYDETRNVIETHEQAGEFKEC